MNIIVRGAIFSGMSALAVFGVVFGMVLYEEAQREVAHEDKLEQETEAMTGVEKAPKEQKQSQSIQETSPSAACYGSARCYTGQVTQIIDGDTIRVGAQSIRFALSSAPEMNQPSGVEARNFVESICPVGSQVLIDEDDGQTQGSYGRILAVIHCNGINLNEAVLDAGLATLSTSFCSTSEFSGQVWAKRYGCGATVPEFKPPEMKEPIPPKQNSCDNSYPTVCIPSSPPDLDCGDIPYSNFKVLQPDPHRFDGDKDGIGCES